MCLVSFSILNSYKTIKYLVLKKGGEQVRIVTYGFLGRSRDFTVPLSRCSCESNPNTDQGKFLLRIYGMRLRLTIDNQGDVRNRKLFNNTVCLKRNFLK